MLRMGPILVLASLAESERHASLLGGRGRGSFEVIWRKGQKQRRVEWMEGIDICEELRWRDVRWAEGKGRGRRRYRRDICMKAGEAQFLSWVMGRSLIRRRPPVSPKC